jgi:hypothetical protein
VIRGVMLDTLVVRCMYMAVVPGPMLAAIASRCCRRRFQQLACACGSYRDDRNLARTPLVNEVSTFKSNN